MTDAMTPQERIRATVRRQPVDRVPYFIWLNPHAACKLMAEYQPSNDRLVNAVGRFAWSRFVKGGEFDAHRLWRAMPLLLDYHSFNWANEYSLELGSDILFAVAATPWHFGRIDLPSLFVGESFRMSDMFGTEIRLGGGIYPDMHRPAIRDIHALKDYRLPDPRVDSYYDIFRRYRQRFPGHGIMTETFGAEDYPKNILFGFQNYMVYLCEYPEEMAAFLEKWIDYQVEVLVRSVRAGADIVFIGDDYGYDHATFLSPRMWKRFIRPGLKRLIDAAHEEGALTMLHSCGFQMTHLQDYVDAGLDMLQAFQPKSGNDFAQAYPEWADQGLTFVTGIDIQQAESWSPEKFKEDIIGAYRAGGRRGRHVLGTSHELQYTMPLGNIRAMFEALAEIKAGKYD